MVDDLVDLLLRGKLPARASVPRLPARLPLTLPFRPRLRLLARLRAPLCTPLGRIRGGRLRARARARARLLLEGAYPLIEPLAATRQLLAATRQLEDERHAALPASLVDRFRIRPLHSGQIRRPAQGPFLVEKDKTFRVRRPIGEPSQPTDASERSTTERLPQSALLQAALG
jgi:hypothetical protein